MRTRMGLDLVKWGATRGTGRSRFVLRRGVLGWGLAMSALSCAVLMLLWPLPVLAIVGQFVLGLLCGWWWGAAVWSASEREWERVHSGGSA